MSQFVAPDGEEYYLTALYLAAHRWGSGTGIFNYQEQAGELLARMRHRPVISGEVPWRGGSRKIQAGALFDEAHNIVLFSPSDERARFSDPSRSEEHTSELQSRQYLVCRLLLENKKKNKINLLVHGDMRHSHAASIKK